MLESGDEWRLPQMRLRDHLEVVKHCHVICGRRLMHQSYVFFFSSRRRHTRLQGDWSSDVCSSDLEGPRVISNLIGCAPADVHIGMPVEVVFEDVSDDWTLFKFTPAKG